MAGEQRRHDDDGHQDEGQQRCDGAEGVPDHVEPFGVLVGTLTQGAGADQGVPEAAQQGPEGHTAGAEAGGGPGQLVADHGQDDARAESEQREVGDAASDASPRDDVHDRGGDDHRVEDGERTQHLAGESVREGRWSELDPHDAERERSDGDVDGPLDGAALPDGCVRQEQQPDGEQGDGAAAEQSGGDEDVVGVPGGHRGRQADGRATEDRPDQGHQGVDGDGDGHEHPGQPGAGLAPGASVEGERGYEPGGHKEGQRQPGHG